MDTIDSMIIRLTRKQKKSLLNKARKSYPMEACGLLFGDIKNEEQMVKRIVTVRNVLNSSTDFQVDPEELLKAITLSEENNIEPIGFFHSHPTPPEPSPTDLKYMRHWPETTWLIISSLSYEMATYIKRHDSVIQIEIRVDD